MYWSSGSGLIELNITKNQANIGYHAGLCDADVAKLIKAPSIKRQLAKLNPEIVRNELREYGSWDDGELLNDSYNLERLLWVACGDIVDGRG